MYVCLLTSSNQFQLFLLLQQLRREDRIRRLQEQQDAAAALAAEKQQEKEDKERKERIQVNFINYIGPFTAMNFSQGGGINCPLSPLHPRPGIRRLFVRQRLQTQVQKQRQLNDGIFRRLTSAAVA